MPFLYTTEYGLGHRGRIQRSYTGIQALIAIAFDLILGFGFGIIGLGLWLVRTVLMTAYRVAMGVFILPLRVVRAVLSPRARRPGVKPAWVSLDEL